MKFFSRILLLLLAVSCGPGGSEVTVRLETGRDPLPAGDFGYNPICPMGVYMADPSAKVIGGRMYVACSLDLNTHSWCSPYHHILSTDDALHWTLHPNVFATQGPLDEVSYSDADLYAPDIAERDGKYYLYYDMSDWTEGVARSDSPAGPFHGGERIGDITGIDPCVFIDDDGQAYYFWDQFSARGAKLNPDMTTLDMSTLHEGIVTEKEHYFHEGSFVFKRDGWYYYVYADISRQNMPTCIGYSMSRSVFGPYEYKGVIVDSNGCDPDVWNNHGSVVEFNGRWYVLYHRSTHHTSKLRKACIEPITFNEDGTINEVEMTSQGAGKPIPASSTIDAARACLVNGGPHIRLMDGRMRFFQVSWMAARPPGNMWIFLPDSGSLPSGCAPSPAAASTSVRGSPSPGPLPRWRFRPGGRSGSRWSVTWSLTKKAHRHSGSLFRASKVPGSVETNCLKSTGSVLNRRLHYEKKRFY